MSQASSRQDDRSPDATHRDEHAQLEYQRRNPHLYTTLSQSVSPDGTLVTFEMVIRNIQEQLDRLQEIHGGNKFWWVLAPKDAQDMYTYLTDNLHRVRLGFVENYKRFQDHAARVGRK